MKSSDAQILMVPGLASPDEGHWQSRWQSRLKTARWVGDADDPADRDSRVAALVAAVEADDKPAVLIAHGVGVLAVAFAAPRLNGRVAGALLVAPADPASAGAPGYENVPRDPLPFPSMLVASASDPHCAQAVADDLAAAWGSHFIDAGDAGHLDSASGHGPWPEGLTRFAMLMARL
ncbi:RBBP9/YdeN family alpha/beta hydrolase [Inquilinus limosus]|uniref:RBBP9/YdeN family alpha/beta hydrolase n=1 Tax=Inquilinus limosus TaxID=171674 RepID=UPI0003F84510|nr:alpha/beta hydrolase [Inquilinus limosus]